MTKCFTLFIHFACLTAIANAQIEKRSTIIGGQVYYYDSNIDYSTNQRSEKNRNTVFDVSAGKAFKRNDVFGVNLAYSPASTRNVYNGIEYVNTDVDAYNAGVFYRRYKSLAKDFYFFLESELSYLHSKQVNTDSVGANVYTSKQSGMAFVLTPGISYRIYKKLHLELLIPNIVTIRYTATKATMPAVTLKQKQFVANTSLNANSPFYFGVGFHFIF